MPSCNKKLVSVYAISCDELDHRDGGFTQRSEFHTTGWLRQTTITAGFISTDHSPEDKTPIRCLHFDSIGARHPDVPWA